MMSNLIDLTGQKFGRLTVIQRVDNDQWGKPRWLCQCGCKNKNRIIILGNNIRRGHTKSCGCLSKEKTSQRFTKHGRSQNDKTYQSWVNMKQRCTNPNYRKYEDYGGRGIKVCKRWLNSFTNFLKDMGERPLDRTIERKNNNKGYYKGNCKWATKKEQVRNTRDNLHITHNGETRLLIEWSEKTGILYRVSYKRIYILGWSIRKALTTPVRGTFCE